MKMYKIITYEGIFYVMASDKAQALTKYTTKCKEQKIDVSSHIEIIRICHEGDIIK